MRFFVDGCISILHARALRLYYGSEGHEFCHLTEKFPADTRDPVWISTLAKETDWVIVETKLLKQAEAVLHWAPRLVAVAKRYPTGHGFNHEQVERRTSADISGIEEEVAGPAVFLPANRADVSVPDPRAERVADRTVGCAGITQLAVEI